MINSFKRYEVGQTVLHDLELSQVGLRTFYGNVRNICLKYRNDYLLNRLKMSRVRKIQLSLMYSAMQRRLSVNRLLIQD